MTFCPIGLDHLVSFEDDGEAYCETHEVRVVQHPAPPEAPREPDAGAH
ncbi:hypothetical protein [Streptomyces sp. NPDC057509]